MPGIYLVKDRAGSGRGVFFMFVVVRWSRRSPLGGQRDELVNKPTKYERAVGLDETMFVATIFEAWVGVRVIASGRSLY